jgi:effector-binding domain-containing protein
MFVPLAHSVPATGRAQSVLVPDTGLAVTIHRADHDNVDRTYGSLGRHVAEHALGVGTPIREYYLAGAEHTADRRAWQTEIAWPIHRTPPQQSPPHPRKEQQ